MEAARIPMRPGMRVLVKPNLLTSKALACTNPDIVAAVCKLLLDGGCKVDVADSPGFGRAKSVARAIGLDEKLAPLGLEVLPMNQPAPLRLDVPGAERQPVFMVSRRAIECDYLLSVPRIKAHSQMRITLAVKNLFWLRMRREKGHNPCEGRQGTSIFRSLSCGHVGGFAALRRVCGRHCGHERYRPVKRHSFQFWPAWRLRFVPGNGSRPAGSA